MKKNTYEYVISLVLIYIVFKFFLIREKIFSDIEKKIEIINHRISLELFDIVDQKISDSQRKDKFIKICKDNISSMNGVSFFIAEGVPQNLLRDYEIYVKYYNYEYNKGFPLFLKIKEKYSKMKLGEVECLHFLPQKPLIFIGTSEVENDK